MRVVLALLLLVAAGTAGAQEEEASAGIAVDRFSPGVGPVVLGQGDGAETTPFGYVSWAASIGVAGDLLRLQGRYSDGTLFRPVAMMVVNDLSFEVGLWKRIAVAVGVPGVLYAEGDRLRGTGISEERLFYPVEGDFRFRAKVAFLGDPARPGLHLGISLNATAPGRGRRFFAATDGATVEPRLHFDLRFARVLVLAQLGVRFAPERRLFTTRFGDEVTWLGGLAVFVAGDGKHELIALAEAAGAIGGDPATRPVELRGGLRAWLGGYSIDVLGGGGVNDAVGAPSYRFVAVFRGAFDLKPFFRR
jgi:hypothetical protein